MPRDCSLIPARLVEAMNQNSKWALPSPAEHRAARGPLAEELRSVINASDLGGRWRDDLAGVIQPVRSDEGHDLWKGCRVPPVERPDSARSQAGFRKDGGTSFARFPKRR